MTNKSTIKSYIKKGLRLKGDWGLKNTLWLKTKSVNSARKSVSQDVKVGDSLDVNNNTTSFANINYEDIEKANSLNDSVQMDDLSNKEHPKEEDTSNRIMFDIERVMSGQISFDDLVSKSSRKSVNQDVEVSDSLDVNNNTTPFININYEDTEKANSLNDSVQMDDLSNKEHPKEEDTSNRIMFDIERVISGQISFDDLVSKSSSDNGNSPNFHRNSEAELKTEKIYTKNKAELKDSYLYDSHSELRIDDSVDDIDDEVSKESARYIRKREKLGEKIASGEKTASGEKIAFGDNIAKKINSAIAFFFSGKIFSLAFGGVVKLGRFVEDSFSNSKLFFLKRSSKVSPGSPPSGDYVEFNAESECISVICGKFAKEAISNKKAGVQEHSYESGVRLADINEDEYSKIFKELDDFFEKKVFDLSVSGVYPDVKCTCVQVLSGIYNVFTSFKRDFLGAGDNWERKRVAFDDFRVNIRGGIHSAVNELRNLHSTIFGLPKINLVISYFEVMDKELVPLLDRIQNHYLEKENVCDSGIAPSFSIDIRNVNEVSNSDTKGMHL